MKKMAIDEAAKFFGVSKEAIHNRIRRGSLEVVIENGKKFVLVDTKNKTKKTSLKTVSAIERQYNEFLHQEIQELKEKVSKLEGETKTLREEKEKLLVEERKRIEQIYKEKDEQLKSILNSISSKFMLALQEKEKDEHIDVEIEEKKEIITLKKFLLKNKVSEKKYKKIKKHILKNLKKDKRFTIDGKKIYLDLKTYSYEDILDT